MYYIPDLNSTFLLAGPMIGKRADPTVPPNN
jgi:hypothetical protein